MKDQEAEGEQGRTFQAEGIVGAKMGVYLLYSRNGKGPSIARVE